MSEALIRKLGDVESAGELELGRGDVISSSDLAAWPGSYPVYSSSAVGEGIFGRYGRYMFDEDLITWSIDGGGRPFYRRKHKYSVTNVCGYLRIRRSDKWSYRYLHALLEKLQAGIQFDYQMKAHPSVIRDLYELRWIPVAEQNQIAHILDTLDTQIRRTEELIAKLEQVKQGLLTDLLTRGIDENGQLRPPPDQAPHLYKDSPLGPVPTKWEIDQLGACACITVGFVGTTSTFYTTSDKGVMFLRTGNITPEGLDVEHVKWVLPEFHAANPKSSLQPGDVVVSRVGYTGNAAVVPPMAAANCANMIIIRCGAQLEPQFLRWVFSSRLIISQVAGFTIGSAQPVLNISLVKRLMMSIPPRTEQRSAVDALEKLEMRIRNEQALKFGLEQSKAGLMNDLLTGRVRVTPLLDKAEQAAS